jgi:hypothetical protein
MKTEDKALALLNDLRMQRGFAPVVELYGSVFLGEALCRAIEQHEAFRQEVSDELIKQGFINASTGIGRFIIPKPKPDPLVEAIEKCAAQMHLTSEDAANALRAALDAAGFEIREKGR